MLLRPSWMLLRVVVVFHANLVFLNPVPADRRGDRGTREHDAHLWSPCSERRPGRIRGGQPLEHGIPTFWPLTTVPCQAMGTAGNREKPPLTT